MSFAKLKYSLDFYFQYAAFIFNEILLQLLIQFRVLARKFSANLALNLVFSVLPSKFYLKNVFLKKEKKEIKQK